MIEFDGHPESFENLSDEDTILIRHLESGLMCRFSPTGTANSMLMDFPVAGETRCATNLGQLMLEIKVSRRIPGQSLDVAAEKRLQRFLSDRPDTTAYRSPLAAPDNHDGIEERLVSVQFVLGGRPRYMQERIAYVGDWMVRQNFIIRHETPNPEDITADVERWRETVASLRARAP